MFLGGNLGEQIVLISDKAFDYAVNSCNLRLKDFMNMFLQSGISSRYAEGSPKYIEGMTGVELAHKVIENVIDDFDFSPAGIEYECSPEYWVGWILAAYQWHKGYDLKKINEYLPVDTRLSTIVNFLKMYYLI